VILRLIFVLSNLASQIARGQNRKYQSVIINFFPTRLDKIMTHRPGLLFVFPFFFLRQNNLQLQ
jgi:hypothetical protein